MKPLLVAALRSTLLLSGLAGCGGGAGVAPPTGLTYAANPATYTKGVAIAPNMPSSGGGAVVSYSVSPSLPAGLSLDPATGALHGTPSVVAPSASYTVTATNSAGSAMVDLTVIVNDAAPTGLTYAANPATYTKGLAIASNAPTSGGGAAVTYAVSPALPAGLSLDPATGVISGTPTALAAQATYAVTASNSGGHASAGLVIAVVQESTLATGNGDTCVIVSGGVWCWGGNAYGQLGNGRTADSLAPVLVQGLTSGAQAIALGVWHACALVDGGGVQCWGFNGHGELGSGSTISSEVPVQVQGLTSGAQTIAAGTFHTCAIVNGGARCWGDNSYGGLGDGSTSDSTVPVQVQRLTSGVQAIAVGYYHACALVDGGVQCWGYNASGQLGNGSRTDSHVPVQVQGLTSGVEALAAGGYHTCAIVRGAVLCWGYGGLGQLGDGSMSDSDVPVQVQGLTSGVQALAAGTFETCAIVGGGIRCWGDDFFGDLGDGSTTQSNVPAQVQGLTHGAQAIAAGNFHSCAIVNGGIQCWGWNNFGQLGDGSTADRHAPVQMTGFPP